MTKIHVMALRPGMHRGGRSNPQYAAYELGEHTAAQLLDLLNDPNFTVIVGGGPLTGEHIKAAETHEAYLAGAEARAAGKSTKDNPWAEGHQAEGGDEGFHRGGGDAELEHGEGADNSSAPGGGEIQKSTEAKPATKPGSTKAKS
jgi:hypothetical protein